MNSIKRARIARIVRKVLGINHLRSGSKKAIMESHNLDKQPRPKILEPHVKSKHEEVIKKAVSNISNKRKERLGEYHINDQIMQKISNVFAEYDSQISLVTALGILDLLKDDLKEGSK